MGNPHAGRVGIELEWIVVPRRGGRAPSPVELAASLPGELPGGSRITFEPGGQLELSGPVAPSLSAACERMRADTAMVRCSLDHLDLDLVGAAIDTRAMFRVCSTRPATGRWRTTSTRAGPRGAP